MLKTKIIDGQEFVLFPWVPTGKEIVFKPKYKTIIDSNSRNYEQRKPETNRPTISFSSKFLYYGLEGEKFFNDLRYVAERYIIVPFPVEAMIASTIASLTTTMTKKHVYNWFLHTFAKYIFALDFANEVYEVQEIWYFDNDFKVTTKEAWTESFDLSKSAFYPALFMRIDSNLDSQLLNSATPDLNLNLTEVFF